MTTTNLHEDLDPSSMGKEAANRPVRRVPRPSHDGGTIHLIAQNLLHGPARWALVALATHGDIYVYHPFGKEPDELKIWIEALAQARPGHDGRVQLDDWRERWREYLRQLL